MEQTHRKRGRKPKVREQPESENPVKTQNELELETVVAPAKKRGRKPKSAGVQPELQPELSTPKKRRGRSASRGEPEPQEETDSRQESVEKPELQPESDMKEPAYMEIFQGPLHQPDLLRTPGKSILKKSTEKSSIPRTRAVSQPVLQPDSTYDNDSIESADRLDVQPEFEVEQPEEKSVPQPESISEPIDRLEDQPEQKDELPAEEKPVEQPELEEQPEPQEEPVERPVPQSESRRLKPVSIRYRTRPFSMRPLFKVKDGKGEDRTLIDDTLVDFYLTEYMVNDVFTDKQRAETHVFNSFFYTGLRDRIDCKIKVTPRRSELADLFKTLYPKFDLSIFEKKILVVPVHLHKPKHWLLVLIDNPLGGTLRLRPPREPEKVVRGSGCSISRVTRLLYDEREVEHLDEQCRILLLDSLRGSEQFREVLAEEYENIFQCLRFFVQMMAAARNEEAFASKIKGVICRVPRQKNHVDCGFFMMTYAEYFTTRFTEWTKWSLDALQFLPIDDFTKEQLRTDGPRESIDRLIALLTEY